MKLALALLAVLYLLQCTQEGLASPVPEGSGSEERPSDGNEGGDGGDGGDGGSGEGGPGGKNLVLEKEHQKQAALQHNAKSSFQKSQQKSVSADQESNTFSGFTEMSKMKLKIPVKGKKN